MIRSQSGSYEPSNSPKQFVFTEIHAITMIHNNMESGDLPHDPRLVTVMSSPLAQASTRKAQSL